MSTLNWIILLAVSFAIGYIAYVGYQKQTTGDCGCGDRKKYLKSLIS